MDVFLIKDGVVVNIASVSSMEAALALFPEFTVIEKTPQNAYLGDSPINPGDPAP